MNPHGPIRTPATSSDLVMTVEEAARQLGVGRTITFGLVQSGQLRSIKIGRRRLIPRSALLQLINERSDEASRENAAHEEGM